MEIKDILPGLSELSTIPQIDISGRRIDIPIKLQPRAQHSMLTSGDKEVGAVTIWGGWEFTLESHIFSFTSATSIYSEFRQQGIYTKVMRAIHRRMQHLSTTTGTVIEQKEFILATNPNIKQALISMLEKQGFENLGTVTLIKKDGTITEVQALSKRYEPKRRAQRRRKSRRRF